GTCIFPGCTDPAADNYDAGANSDDGSCIYLGCTNVIADNYDPQANVDDGSCIISGCTDTEADNYYSEANYDDGSCYYLGCTDPSADNYDITATVEDGSCLYYGCTDVLANNFEFEANFDDGSCVYSYAIFSLNTDSACAPVTIVVNNQTDVAPGSQCLLNDGNGDEYDTCADEYVLEYDVPGTYYITLQYIQSTESTTFIDSIIVYPPAGAPVLTYFEGPPAYLSTSNDGAGTYQWWLDDVQIAVSDTSSLGIDNGGIVDNGYYQVHYTDIHGCDAWSDTLLVLQPQFYVVEDSLCAIASFEFIDQTDQVEGALCEILLNEGMLCIPGSNIITVDEPGNYEVGIQYMVGEEIFGPVYSDVVVLPTPEVPTLIADGNAMALLCEGCSGNTIQWYNSDSVLVQTGDTLLVTGNYPEKFYVVITNDWGCSNSSETTTFPLSVSEPLQTNHLAVFPNPTSDFIMLTAAHAPGTINMYDATGALVLSMYAPGNRTPIDLSRLAPGLYQLYAGGCRVAVVVE
ncbi:MAG: T9SS type A sorting domain-containing protein, partial [Flavobacteriales bacterium]|nr:T9SS type A sorting domain-containing protein [Flavobacteriales bacterium]